MFGVYEIKQISRESNGEWIFQHSHKANVFNNEGESAGSDFIAHDINRP